MFINKRHIYIAAIIIITIFCSFILNCAYAQENNREDTINNTIKVGYFQLDGFNDISQEGQFSGYGYEYLMEIAKYTKWNYDFVYKTKNRITGKENRLTYEEALKMLELGEVDLVCNVMKTEDNEKRFEFPNIPLGDTYGILSTTEDVRKYNLEKISSLNGMVIGVLEGSAQNDEIVTYLKNNNIQFQLKRFSTLKEAKIALFETKLVDAIYTTNMRQLKDEKVILRLNASSIYVVVNKGNNQLCSQLDLSLKEIIAKNSNFSMDLYEIQEEAFVYRHPLMVVIVICSLWLGIAMAMVIYHNRKFMKTVKQEMQLSNKGIHTALAETKMLVWEYDLENKRIIRTKCSKDSMNLGNKIENVPECFIESGYIHSDCAQEFLNMFDKILNGEKVASGLFKVAKTENQNQDKEQNAKENQNQIIKQNIKQNKKLNQSKYKTENQNQAIKKNIKLNQSKYKTQNQNQIQNANQDRDKYIWTEIKITNIFDDNGKPVRAVALEADVTEKVNAELRLKDKASRDALTNLLNRTSFQAYVEEFLDKEYIENLISALIIIDIDDFKKANDTYGHLYGDEVLRGIASKLTKSFRTGDLIGRLGGDEFIVFIKNATSYEMIDKKAKYICNNLIFEKEELITTCSVGIAIVPNKNVEYEFLYKSADESMYEAKRCGKCTYVISATGEIE